MFPFKIDESSDVPPWVQLRQRLIYLINSGYYKPGDQLPTVRALASDISLNYNTVNKAYLSLASDGYVEATRGRGAFVRDFDADVGSDYSREIDELISDCVNACRCLGLSLGDIQKYMTRKIQMLKHDESMSIEASNLGVGRIVEIESELARQRKQTGA